MSSTHCSSEIGNWQNSNIKARYTSAKRRWTMEEHQSLLELVDSYDKRPPVWSEIATQLAGRTPKRCRERYLNFAGVPTRLRGERWSEHEDRTIAGFHSSSPGGVIPWCHVASLLEGRTQHQIKNHWNSVFRAKDIHTRVGSWLCLYVNALRKGSQPHAALHAADAAWTKQLIDQAEAHEQAAARTHAAAATQGTAMAGKVNPVQPLLPEFEFPAIPMARAWHQTGSGTSTAATSSVSASAHQAVTTETEAAALPADGAVSTGTRKEFAAHVGAATNKRATAAAALAPLKGVDHARCAVECAGSCPSDHLPLKPAHQAVTKLALYMTHGACCSSSGADHAQPSSGAVLTPAADGCMHTASRNVVTASAVCAQALLAQRLTNVPADNQTSEPDSHGAVGRKRTVDDLQAVAEATLPLRGQASIPLRHAAHASAAASFRHGTAAAWGPCKGSATSGIVAAPIQAGQGRLHMAYSADAVLQQAADINSLQHVGGQASEPAFQSAQSRSAPAYAVQLDGIAAATITAAAGTNLSFGSLGDVAHERLGHRCSWGGPGMLGFAPQSKVRGNGGDVFEDPEHSLNSGTSDSWLDVLTDVELNSLLLGSVAGSASHCPQIPASATAAAGALHAMYSVPDLPANVEQAIVSPRAMQSEGNAVLMQLCMASASQVLERVRLCATSASPHFSPKAAVPIEAATQFFSHAAAVSASGVFVNADAAPCLHADEPAACAAPQAMLGTTAPMTNNIHQRMGFKDSAVSIQHANAVCGATFPWADEVSMAAVAAPLGSTHGSAPPTWTGSTVPAVRSAWLVGKTTELAPAGWLARASCAFPAASGDAAGRAAMQPCPEPSNSQAHHQQQQEQLMPAQHDSGACAMPALCSHASMHQGRMLKMYSTWSPAGPDPCTRHGGGWDNGSSADSAAYAGHALADRTSMAPCAGCQQDWMPPHGYGEPQYGYPSHLPMNRSMQRVPWDDPDLNIAMYGPQYMASEQMPASMQGRTEEISGPGYSSAPMSGTDTWTAGGSSHLSMPYNSTNYSSVSHSIGKQYSPDGSIDGMPGAGINATVEPSEMSRRQSHAVQPPLAWGFKEHTMHLDVYGHLSMHMT